MENSDGQPEPLNIVKRSRNTAIDRGSGYDINTQRMSSVDTNESMDSLCGFLDVNGSLTLPKRRRPQPPHRGGRRGAERFATLASKARRRLNVTDNLGANAETDNDQINAFRHGIGSRSRSGTTRYYSPASMQPQDLHTEGFDADTMSVQQQLFLSTVAGTICIMNIVKNISSINSTNSTTLKILMILISLDNVVEAP
ncbi:hypothetical protein SPI_06448 [Niveomyces insectorum RCEF 264]|uniref:Uncharacterized protein n=1 Tax=Niveomyces insectorum RCEF 264 TaxID=1081102 RepID=A0A167R8W8_9HYPO|nr:hypothetical protein SPI_06448 [Niveomyces insectorum RCEF 264]